MALLNNRMREVVRGIKQSHTNGSSKDCAQHSDIATAIMWFSFSRYLFDKKMKLYLSNLKRLCDECFVRSPPENIGCSLDICFPKEVSKPSWWRLREECRSQHAHIWTLESRQESLYVCYYPQSCTTST